MAKTTVSSVFGEYFTAQDGLPVYDTWDDGISNGDGSPVYETDAYGRAIPYTGIVLRYIQYKDANGQITHDPDLAETTIIVSDPNDASYATRKEAGFDTNGNIVYNLVRLKDNKGNDLRKQQAFKVYYRSTDVANDPRSYSFGRYGQFAGHEYFYFEENFNNLFTAESGEAYNYTASPLYMGNLQKYTAADITSLSNGIYSNGLPPYVVEGGIKWGVPGTQNGDYNSTSGDTTDYNDGHTDSNGRFIGVLFIEGYGPDKIAYHKVRKMKIKSTSGIITRANMDSAFATVFAQHGQMYSAIVNMTTEQGAFVTAVANAVANQTSSGQSTAKMIADGSMYLARTQYKDSNDNWNDIATEEEDYLIGQGVQLQYNVTRPSNVPSNSDTRIKPSGEDIEWVQDTTYIYGGKMHTFEQLKKDISNGNVSIGVFFGLEILMAL